MRSFPLIQNRMARYAFTLVEVMTAVAIISIVSVGLHMGISNSFAVVRTCRENLRATQILVEKMETVRLYSWDQINQAGFIPATFTVQYNPAASAGNQGVVYSGTLAVTGTGISETYSGNTKLFVATVTWTSGGVTHQRQMRTFASKYGLQNYVYPLIK
jgi:prepilin-type N-terminal cleavage/methylation domain-containing protein